MSGRLRALPRSLPRIERSPRGALGGVCSGIAEAGAVDPTIVRLAFAFLALVGGSGVAAYAAAWLALPVAGGEPVSARRRTLGVVVLAAAFLLALHGLGLSGALLSTTSGGRSQPLAPAALIAAIALVFGPWAWRLMREREAERAERIRTAEHAALAARVHDSVLQTLALIQREPDDARRVATLARRQERELRSWLYPEPHGASGDSLATAIEAAAAEIEELESVRVEIVRTGDAELDERSRELVLAVREAIRNAAAHSGASDVSVFVDASDGQVAIYVRDRGAGFDPDAVPADRRGIADSIRARMARIGGSATVASTVGRGTEVELRL